MQIRIAVVKQLPANTPTTTTISNNCTENIQNPWGLIIHSQNCEQKFIGKTNRLGQILLFENSHHAGVVQRSYVIATVINSNPVDNSIVDGIIKYTNTSMGIDTWGTSITSAFVHALEPDMSDWTSISWPV
jgi:hypothetical protein